MRKSKRKIKTTLIYNEYIVDKSVNKRSQTTKPKVRLSERLQSNYCKSEYKSPQKSFSPKPDIKLTPKKIRNLTLFEIKKCQKNPKLIHSTQDLFRVKSKSLREEMYKEAADAIALREESSLPAFGGRPWKCNIKLIEKSSKACPSNSSTPLFRWFRGNLELACLPHILEKIPEYSIVSDDDDTRAISSHALEDRKVSSVSLAAIQTSELPQVERTWISPQRQCFKSRTAAEENAKELHRQNLVINRVLLGYGKNNQLLNPTNAPRNLALEAGLYRFHRDGLWVVGQEEMWQEERAKLIELAQQAEAKMTPMQYYIHVHKEKVFNKQDFCDEEIMKTLKRQWRQLDSEEKKLFAGRAKKRDHPKIEFKKTTRRWRLSKKHQEECVKVCIDHYESVLYTVKIKQLYPELEKGFDVFRERGRGRFDMEIPSLDNDPIFSFLNDENAVWMPIVKKILGDDAFLIHKGFFLSLPGSETQVYHQDGPHLSDSNQRPCHAVNVFIPLVDLNPKNGPTEFCLGTHILGNDAYKKENIVTPLVKAGEPIIFDYRLGHRGMSNSSSEPRPILYLTYSSSNFRDSVNFSRKRYCKLGELVPLPMSRTERFQQRAEKKKGV